MSNKKVRAGHRIFLTKVIEEVEQRLHDEYAAIGKAELLKWKASLKEQLDKILPLDEQILAELGADEKVTEEEVADTTQALADRASCPARFIISTARQSDEPELKPRLQLARQPAEGSKLREDHCLTQHRAGFREGKKGPYTSIALFTTRGDDKRCAFCLGTHSPEDCKKVTNIKINIVS